MPATREQLTDLRAPIDPAYIQFRVGSVNAQHARGLALAYIDARAVQERLDSVVGPENWSLEYACQPYTVYKHDQSSGKKIAIESHAWTCRLSINTENGWVTKSDGAEQTAMEQVKGGMSDAFKRAAVAWGIGRALYNFPQIWTGVKKLGRTWVIEEVPSIPQWYVDGFVSDPAMMGQATVEPPKASAPQPAPAAHPASGAPDDPFTPPKPAAAMPVPANFPAGVDPNQTVNFGKKLMKSGRPIKDYTWGEIALLPDGSEERNYIKWLSTMAAEKRNKGERPFKAMEIAETLMTWFMTGDASAASDDSNVEASAEEIWGAGSSSDDFLNS
tara:strand:- start:4101 stop:5090 length:990 start_codon:yes stop_codon:yes gene_type:complete